MVAEQGLDPRPGITGSEMDPPVPDSHEVTSRMQQHHPHLHEMATHPEDFYCMLMEAWDALAAVRAARGAEDSTRFFEMRVSLRGSALHPNGSHGSTAHPTS